MSLLRHIGWLLVASCLLPAACQSPPPPPPVYLLTANVHDRCMQVLREGLRAGDTEAAAHAAEALSEAGYAFEVQPVLLDRLSQAGDDAARSLLIGELVRSGEGGSLPLLVDLLLVPDIEVRVAAARVLFGIGRAGDVGILTGLLQEEGDERLRLYAAAALDRADRGEWLDFIRSRAASDDPIVRATAADVLMLLGEARDLPVLREGLARAEFETDRHRLERALAVLGDGEARRALLAQLSHTDSVTRSHAAHAVAEAWLVEASSRLYQLLDDPVMDVRVRAARALLVLSNPEAPAYLRRVQLDRG